MKHQTIAQRTLGVLLSVGMLLSMCPTPALADALADAEQVAMEQTAEVAETEAAEDVAAEEQAPAEVEEAVEAAAQVVIPLLTGPASDRRPRFRSCEPL